MQNRIMCLKCDLLECTRFQIEIWLFVAARSRQGGGHVARYEEIVLEQLIECKTMTGVRSEQLVNERTSGARD